jgi:hypothetical protein
MHPRKIRNSSRPARERTLLLEAIASRASTIFEIGALSDLDKITVRIADVAARLAVLGDRLCDELRSSAFP